MAGDQRQHDHPVERDQEAARRRIVDRGDAAFRRAGPQEGAEQEVEGAPVEQCLEDLLAELMADALGIADATQHDAAGDEQRYEGNDVEQQQAARKARSGEWPTRRSIVRTRARLKQQPRNGLGRQARGHDAEQQQSRAAVDDAGQLPQMPAQGGNLMDGEVHPLGQDLEEGAVGGYRPIGRRPRRPIRRRSRRSWLANAKS